VSRTRLAYGFGGLSLAFAIAACAWAMMARDEARQLASQLDAAHADLNALQSRLEVSSQDADSLRTQLSSASDELVATSTALKSKSSQLASSAAKATAAQSQVKLAQQQAKAAQSQITVAQSQAQAAEARAQASAAQLAQQSRPELPVSLMFRHGLLGGYVAVLENNSTKPLQVLLDVQNGASATVFTRSLTLDPNHTQQFGKRQGWEFEPGQIVKLDNPDFKPVQRTVVPIQPRFSLNQPGS
jgi:hypothetical protein